MLTFSPAATGSVKDLRRSMSPCASASSHRAFVRSSNAPDAVEPREDRLDDRRLRLVPSQDAREVQDPEEETGQHHRLQRPPAATHRQDEQRELRSRGWAPPPTAR